MDDETKEKNNDDVVSEEEKQAEEEALSEVKDEELRSKIAKDLDIDPEDEPELLDKLVERERSQREKTSKAIKQKIGWREKATQKTSSKKPEEKPKEGESHTKEGEKPLTASDVTKLLEERDAKRDLDSLNLDEEIESEVKDLAKVKGISVRDAAKLPYIVSRIEEVKKAKRIASATPKRTSKGGSTSKDIDPSKPLNPDDFALDTEEGQKAWAEAKAAKRRFESKS